MNNFLTTMIATVGAPDNIHTEADEIAFSIGSLDVAWYGIFIFIGFVIAILCICIKL